MNPEGEQIREETPPDSVKEEGAPRRTKTRPVNRSQHAKPLLDPEVEASKVDPSTQPAPGPHTDDSEAHNNNARTPTVTPYTKTESTMAIKPFRGTRSGSENPDEFVEEVEFLYITAYNQHAPGDQKEREAFGDTTCRILFRQNLQDRAAAWYAEQTQETKATWRTLRERFLQAYRQEVDEVAEKYQVIQRIANLA